MTQEHVIPKAIGGNLFPTNPFSLNRVCKRCNNLCGAYIDGPFIKNWLTSNFKSTEIAKYADISRHPVLPLSYFGILDEIKYGDKICEMWLGPTGDTIYHFHEPYPEIEDISPMVGIPTYAKQKDIDPGFSFLFIRSNNPAWHKTIILSFVEQFDKSILYLGNGPTPIGGRFSDIPEELSQLYERLRSLSGQQHKLSVMIKHHYGDRFLAKIALGIGALFLSDDFAVSSSASLLRTFMWTKSQNERQQLKLHGSGFLEGTPDSLKQILNWPGGHVIALITDNNNLNLYCSFYGFQNAVVRVTSEPELWKDRINDDGIVFLIAPGIQKYVGPIELSKYIAHKFENDLENEQLLRLEEDLENKPELPPYNI